MEIHLPLRPRLRGEEEHWSNLVSSECKSICSSWSEREGKGGERHSREEGKTNNDK